MTLSDFLTLDLPPLLAALLAGAPAGCSAPSWCCGARAWWATR
jgi:hypothetical protein